MKTIKTKGLAKDLTFTGALIAIGVLLPSVFHAFNLGGAVFLPMQIPVIICGFLVGRRYGLICGLVVPLLSSVTTGMPPLFPVALTMSIELGAYGYVAGLLVKKVNLYVALISAQIIGRMVGALGSFILLGIAGKPFALSAYMASTFITALPGIILQIILIPIGIMFIRRVGLGKHYE